MTKSALAQIQGYSGKNYKKLISMERAGKLSTLSKHTQQRFYNREFALGVVYKNPARTIYALNKGANKNATFDGGRSALHCSCMHLKTLSFYAKGLCVNPFIKNNNGLTARETLELINLPKNPKKPNELPYTDHINLLKECEEIWKCANPKSTAQNKSKLSL